MIYLTYSGQGSGGGGGGGGGNSLASNAVSLASGSISQSFTYTNTLLSAYAPILGAIINTIDATPIFLQAIVTAFSTTGFTVTFNVAPDTANYKLPYIVVANI